jgi:hypothetical protein
MALTVDTRTATETALSALRSGRIPVRQLQHGTKNPSSITAARTAPALNSSQLSGAGGGYVAVEMAFIQFAGFTFGKSASRPYATPWNGYPCNNNSFLMGGADYVTGVNNIAVHRAVRQRRVGHHRSR